MSIEPTYSLSCRPIQGPRLFELLASEPDEKRVRYAVELSERQSYAEALALFRELDERGSTAAAVYIGSHFSHGFGVTQDKNEAKRWYAKAAERGYVTGEFYTGVLEFDRQNYHEALDWFVKASERGLLPANYWLYKVYLALGDSDRNRDAAERHLRLAADGGHLWAQRQIARKMIKGERGPLQIIAGLFYLIVVVIRGIRCGRRYPEFL